MIRKPGADAPEISPISFHPLYMRVPGPAPTNVLPDFRKLAGQIKDWSHRASRSTGQKREKSRFYKAIVG